MPLGEAKGLCEAKGQKLTKGKEGKKELKKPFIVMLGGNHCAGCKPTKRDLDQMHPEYLYCDADNGGGIGLQLAQELGLRGLPTVFVIYAFTGYPGSPEKFKEKMIKAGVKIE